MADLCERIDETSSSLKQLSKRQLLRNTLCRVVLYSYVKTPRQAGVKRAWS